MLGARKANIVREEPRFLRSKMKLGDRNPLTNETITVICLNLGGKKRDFIFEQFDSKTQASGACVHQRWGPGMVT
jgi:hypothetical protein